MQLTYNYNWPQAISAFPSLSSPWHNVIWAAKLFSRFHTNHTKTTKHTFIYNWNKWKCILKNIHVKENKQCEKSLLSTRRKPAQSGTCFSLKTKHIRISFLSKTKRKVDDEITQFQDRWILLYEVPWKCYLPQAKTCCSKRTQSEASLKNTENNMRSPSGMRGKKEPRSYIEDSSQRLFHKAKKDSEAAVEASCVLSELIAKAIHWSAVSVLLHVARGWFSMSRIEELVPQYLYISKQCQNRWTSYQVTSVNSYRPEDCFIRDINEKFEVTEERLSLWAQK